MCLWSVNDSSGFSSVTLLRVCIIRSEFHCSPLPVCVREWKCVFCFMLSSFYGLCTHTNGSRSVESHHKGTWGTFDFDFDTRCELLDRDTIWQETCVCVHSRLGLVLFQRDEGLPQLYQWTFVLWHVTSCHVHYACVCVCVRGSTYLCIAACQTSVEIWSYDSIGYCREGNVKGSYHQTVPKKRNRKWNLRFLRAVQADSCVVLK